MVKNIVETIIDKSPNVHFNDIEGLEDVKKTLYENIVYP